MKRDPFAADDPFAEDDPFAPAATDGCDRATANPAAESASYGPVVTAVLRDLAVLATRAPELAQSGLAATALSLARQIDLTSSAHGSSMASKALLDIWNRLLDLAPVTEERDELSDLRTRRAQRLDGGAAAGA